MYTSYSPNMLKTYDMCPKKFFYRYIEQITIPQIYSPFEKGAKIHALANYFLRGINISRIETALTEEEKHIWHTLLNNPFFQKDYYNSEYQISCKINKYWIGGRLDAVVHDGSEYYILDYKTGKLPQNPEYDYQTMVYLLALSKLLVNYSKISFVYIDLKNKNNHIIEFNQKLKNEYEEKITTQCDKINNTAIYKKQCTNCRQCEFIQICHNNNDDIYDVKKY